METTPANSTPPNNQPPTAQPVSQPPAAPPVDLKTLAEEACEILGTMLPMLTFDTQISSAVENEAIRVRLECQDAGRLIGRKGATVNEIQFLLNRILQRRHKNIARIFLDVIGPPRPEEPPEDKNRCEVLGRVQPLIEQVRRWGEPMELAPMNVHDREIIQDFFAKENELEIVPVGDSPDAAGLQKMRLQLKEKPKS